MLALALGTTAMAGPAEAQLKFNPNQVAILRWYQANQAGATFQINGARGAVAFDGANIWLVGNNLTKLRASDGTVLSTFAMGGEPDGVAFDGANIWVANQLDSSFGQLSTVLNGLPDCQ